MASNQITLASLNGANDPAEIGWPPTLPIELALRTGTTRSICEGYGIDKEAWEILKAKPLFLDAVARVHETLKKEGMSFKLKAMLQSEELLKTSWALIHAPSAEVPASVKADLIKTTIRAAGLDASLDQKGASTAAGMQVNIVFGLG
jgi:hypothetical protein